MSMMTMQETKEASPNARNSLNAHDRCERCNAQAYFVVAKNMLELNFCLHHYNKHQDSLEENGWTVLIDESHKLLKTPEIDTANV